MLGCGSGHDDEAPTPNAAATVASPNRFPVPIVGCRPQCAEDAAQVRKNLLLWPEFVDYITRGACRGNGEEDAARVCTQAHVTDRPRPLASSPALPFPLAITMHPGVVPGRRAARSMTPTNASLLALQNKLCELTGADASAHDTAHAAFRRYRAGEGPQAAGAGATAAAAAAVLAAAQQPPPAAAVEFGEEEDMPM